MRVYLASTLPRLAAARACGAFGTDAGDLSGHAVTAAVREWYVSGDLEELEFAAMTDAAEAALSLLAEDLHNDPAAAARRVVVAADVPDAVVQAGGRFRSSVRLLQPVPVAGVASVHVDEVAAEPTVRAAVVALPAAEAGDDDAQFLLDEAEATDLLWYDATELDTIP